METSLKNTNRSTKGVGLIFICSGLHDFMTPDFWLPLLDKAVASWLGGQSVEVGVDILQT